MGGTEEGECDDGILDGLAVGDDIGGVGKRRVGCTED